MNGGPAPTLATRTRTARYLLAFAIVVAGALTLLLGGQRVCRDEVPATATVPVRVCAPPSVTEVEVVAVLAIVVLLLAPDLGEAGIAGMTLKRRVEEAKADAAEARADAAEVRLAMTSMRQDIRVSTTASATTVVESDAASLVDAFARIGLFDGVVPRDVGRTAEAPEGDVSPAMHALLVSTAVQGMQSLVPEEWRPATVMVRVSGLTFTAGPEPSASDRRALRRRHGPLDAAARGELAVDAETATSGEVVAAPITDARGGHLGELLLALPPGRGVGTAEAVAEDLATALDAATAVATYAFAHAVVAPRARILDCSRD